MSDVGIIIQSCPHYKAIVEDVVRNYTSYKEAYAYACKEAPPQLQAT